MKLVGIKYPPTIQERRAAYMADPGKKERKARVDFAPPKRSTETMSFDIDASNPE